MVCDIIKDSPAAVSPPEHMNGTEIIFPPTDMTMISLWFTVFGSDSILIISSPRFQKMKIHRTPSKIQLLKTPLAHSHPVHTIGQGTGGRFPNDKYLKEKRSPQAWWT